MVGSPSLPSEPTVVLQPPKHWKSFGKKSFKNYLFIFLSMAGVSNTTIGSDRSAAAA
jgi:hypothetical protein